MAFLCIMIFCGCSSLSGKLSDSEQLTLIDIARYTITKQNRKFVTAKEANEINNKMPEVRIHYTGPKQGKIWISWDLDEKKINFTGYGELVPEHIMWQMYIAKHKSKVSKKELDPFRRRPPARTEDFAGLLKKDKIIPPRKEQNAGIEKE